MQPVELLHGGGSNHRDTRAMQAKFDEEQTSKGYHTGQNMTAHFAICPTADGHEFMSNYERLPSNEKGHFSFEKRPS
jgi:hypothetical protein